MWCEKLNNGKYRYADRYLDPLTGKTKRVSVVMEKNTRQAQKQAQEAIYAKIAAQMRPQTKDIRFGKLVDLYLKEQEKTVKKSTWKRNYFACCTLKEILDADTLANQLTAGYIRQQFLATGKEPGTLNEHMTRLKALLRWGYRNDYLADIRYLDKLERFQDIPHRQKIEDKFLEGEELVKLLAAMSLKKWRDLTVFLALSGLRFGEAAALLRSDVDLKNRKIYVSKTYDAINEITTSPKTYTSTREVYMQDELCELCRQLLASGYIRTNVIRINAGNLFFVDDDGGHLSYAAYNHYLRRCAEEAIGRSITPHTLRHTHASLMMEHGMDIDAIAARLGHSNSKVTREIYLHVTEKMKEKQNEQIREIKILPHNCPAN